MIRLPRLSRSLRALAALALVPMLAGCAGGWRGGAPPAEWAVEAATSTPSAPTSIAATSKPSRGTHATADGVAFVWKGEGNSVNVAGEFNAWSTTADPLKKQADGSWLLDKTLAPGKYAYKFVIDGGNWKPDPTVTDAVDDGYGGKNSVITVGGAAAPAAAAPATTAPAATAAASGGTHATPDGAAFVWKGEGSTVNVAGEFNAWSTSADPMKKQPDGSWLLEKKLAPGKYAYKFVINGTDWKPDPTVTDAVDDGFGGKNSVISVGGTGTAAAEPAPAAQAPGPPATPGGGPEVTADGVVFRYAGPANTVNLAGEFNSWSTTADPMTKNADGSFTLTKTLPPGRYQYKFVVDGGNWKEDPNAAESTDDGYGGKNSVVVVGGTGAKAGAAPAPAAAAAPAVKPLVPGAKPQAPKATTDGVVFTYAGPATKGVALCGDFNGWATTADPMTQAADGTWTITKKLAAGTYAYKFLVDGSNWKTDEGNSQTQDDGFGGKNSVLVVK